MSQAPILPIPVAPGPDVDMFSPSRLGPILAALESRIAALESKYIPNASVAFNTAVPLYSNCQMPAQTITSALQFTVGPVAVDFGRCIVRLTADGNPLHIPDFSAFTATSDSLPWVNTAGTVNQVTFWWSSVNGQASPFVMITR